MTKPRAIAAIGPAEFEEREKELLVLAKGWMPRLPFESADVLLVDEDWEEHQRDGHGYQRRWPQVLSPTRPAKMRRRKSRTLSFGG